MHSDPLPGGACGVATAEACAGRRVRCAAGRLLSVPLAWCCRPVPLLGCEFGLACASVLLLVALGQRSYPWLVVSAAGTGLGIAALYPQGLLLAKQRAPLSSAWISRLVVGALVGSVLGPPAVGSLLEGWPACLFYAVLLVVLVQTACFVLVALLPRHRPPARRRSELGAPGGKELASAHQSSVELGAETCT